MRLTVRPSRAFWWLAGPAVGLSIATGLSAATSAPQPVVPTHDRSWLALGDSYSSGEGSAGTQENELVSRNNSPDKKDCRRSTGWIRPGAPTPAKAWAVKAYEQVRDVEHFSNLDFVACTRDITDDWAAQVEEARTRWGRNRWDIVSFSFGGNNIGFSDIATGCIVSEAPLQGCTVNLDTIKARVDALMGHGAQYTGTVSFPDLLDHVATDVANRGGDVIVAGYPQLIEDPSKWGKLQSLWGGCAGFHAKDVGMLREATAYLNDRIKEAVSAADTKFGAAGVHFHFADLANGVYETGQEPANRHGLCTATPWLNGLSTGLFMADGNYMRSFHPQQAGHDATGAYVADLVRREVRFDDQGVTIGGGRPVNPTVAQPYTAQDVCGSGFEVVDQKPLGGAGTVWLLWDRRSQRNCVVTLKRQNVGRPTAVNAYLRPVGSTGSADPNQYRFYAGPVRLKAPGCIRWGGSIGKLKFDSPVGHCGG